MVQRKSYPINKSPLYKLNNKKRLAAILDIALSELKKICSNPLYKEFIKEEESGKKRQIKSPYVSLKKVQKKLLKIIQRIETPSWLYSGKRGVSHIENAKAHQSMPNVVCVDIENFYPNIKPERIFQFFKHDLQQAGDIALMLRNLVTYNDQLPQGSPTSQILAYWANKKTFERLNETAEKLGIKMSVYVDDVTFSCEKPLPKNFLKIVQIELSKVGLSLKKSKIKKFSKNDHKEITGCIISPTKILKIKNKHGYEIIKLAEKQSSEGLTLKEKQTLVGKLNSVRQIEHNIFSSVKVV